MALEIWREPGGKSCSSLPFPDAEYVAPSIAAPMYYGLRVLWGPGNAVDREIFNEFLLLATSHPVVSEGILAGIHWTKFRREKPQIVSVIGREF